MDKDHVIDLLNVAFGNCSSSVDRKQAIEAHQELSTLYPSRHFRLVFIDISKQEFVSKQPEIEKLIYPSNTVLDLSISAALWFASRGKGYYLDAQTSSPVAYTSIARVILIGIGSDEQLAGYGRHRTLFRKLSWPGMCNELDMDIRRLWLRNLERDDRIISSHGKEVRSPFLDEEFIEYIRELPLWKIADMKLSPGEGDKMILRRATKKIGLATSATYVKRAIQFGSNVAKMLKTSRHTKGQDTLDIKL